MCYSVAIFENTPSTRSLGVCESVGIRILNRTFFFPLFFFWGALFPIRIDATLSFRFDSSSLFVISLQRASFFFFTLEASRALCFQDILILADARL